MQKNSLPLFSRQFKSLKKKLSLHLVSFTNTFSHLPHKELFLIILNYEPPLCAF